MSAHTIPFYFFRKFGLFDFKHTDYFNSGIFHKKFDFKKICFRVGKMTTQCRNAMPPSMQQSIQIRQQKIPKLDPLNNIPRNNTELMLSFDELEPFAADVLSVRRFPPEEKMEFFRRFLITYITDEDYKRKVQNYLVVFLENRYAGIFRTVQDVDEYTKYKNIKGMYVDIFPISQNYLFERPEINIFSPLVKQVEVDCITGEEVTIEVYPELTVKCSIYSTNNPVDRLGETYMIDTGCYGTHLPYSEYFSEGLYYEYPFNPDGSVEISTIKSKKDLPKLNDTIVRRISTYSKAIGNVKISRLLVFFNNTVVLSLEKNIQLNPKFLIAQRLEPVKGSNKLSLNAMASYVGFGMAIERPPPETKLLGRDSLLQIRYEGGPVFDGISKLTLNEHDKNKHRAGQLGFYKDIYGDINGGQEKFEILLLSLNITLYCPKMKIYDPINNVFYFNKSYDKNNRFGIVENFVHIIDDSNTMTHFLYRLIKPLLLVNIFNTSRENMTELENKIRSDGNYDGWISVNNNFPNNVELWLKNYSMLIDEQEIVVPYIGKDFMLNYIQYQVVNEKQIIDTNKLTSYFTEL